MADVEFGAKIKRGDAGSNGTPAVIMSIQKQPGASTLELTEKIDTALAELQANLPEDIEVNANLFRQANFIDTSISNVIEALRDGAILVVIVLFLFLLEFSHDVYHFDGDSAFVRRYVFDFQSVRYFDQHDDFRRFSRRHRRTRGRRDCGHRKYFPAFAGKSKTRKIRARRSKSFITLAGNPLVNRLCDDHRRARFHSAFCAVRCRRQTARAARFGLYYRARRVAVCFVDGYARSCFISFAENEGDARRKRRFSGAFSQKMGRKILHRTLRHPWIVIIGATAFIFNCISTLPFVGTSFLPEFNEGTLTVNVQAQPGTSLSESDRIGQIAEKLLLEVPEVISTGRRTGRAEMDEHAEGVHYTEIDVDLKKDGARDREEIIDDIREKLALIPGVSTNVGQPISHRIDHLQSGVRAQIAVKLFGDDLQILRSKAEEIRNVMEGVPGATDVLIEKQVLIPQIRFNVDRDGAAQYGLKPGEMSETLETALNGKIVSEAVEGQRRFDVVVRFADSARNSLDALKDVTIDTPNGSANSGFGGR